MCVFFWDNGASFLKCDVLGCFVFDCKTLRNMNQCGF